MMVIKKNVSKSKNAAKNGVGGCLCLDFLNTTEAVGYGQRHDRLETYQDLVRLVQTSGFLDQKQGSLLLALAAQDAEGAQAALCESKLTRANLMHVLKSAIAERSPRREDLDEFNQRLSEALRRCAVCEEDGTLVLRLQELGLVLVSPLWPILKNAAELMTSPLFLRLKTCASTSCGRFFLDATKNRTRQWCEMRTCGNRAKAQRHRARSRNNG